MRQQSTCLKKESLCRSFLKMPLKLPIINISVLPVVLPYLNRYILTSIAVYVTHLNVPNQRRSQYNALPSELLARIYKKDTMLFTSMPLWLRTCRNNCTCFVFFYTASWNAPIAPLLASKTGRSDQQYKQFLLSDINL